MSEMMNAPDDRIERVIKMEDRLNRVRAWLDGKSTEDVEPLVIILEAYYRSSLWRQDFEDDETDKIPADLPRGVLSEDAVYNTLTEYDERRKKQRFDEVVLAIPAGRYRHFKGNEYEVIGIARHSEDESPMVVYKALYGDGGLWVRPASMWNETITRDGKAFKRFEKID